MGHVFSSKPSWTPKTQTNNALRRCLVEFLVFNSAFGRCSWLMSTISHHHQCSWMHCQHLPGCTVRRCCQWQHLPGSTVRRCCQCILMVMWYGTHQSTASIEGRVEHQKLLVEFLVFNSAFGRWSWLMSTISHHHQCFLYALSASSWMHYIFLDPL